MSQLVPYLNFGLDDSYLFEGDLYNNYQEVIAPNTKMVRFLYYYCCYLFVRVWERDVHFFLCLHGTLDLINIFIVKM